MFEHFKNYKLKSNINKFQAEDLYIKREQAIPYEIMESMEVAESRQESVEGKIS